MATAADTYNPVRNGFKGPRKLKLRDPRNVNSQLSPDDFDIPSYNADLYPANPKYATFPGHDADVLQMMNDRVISAINYKRVKEPVWYESLAYYMGTQDVTWNYRARMLVPMRNASNVHKSFSNRNKIKVKVKKLTYQAFSQKPDAAIKASTMSTLDRQAAAEARSVLSHCDYMFHRDQQVRRMGHWSFITGTCALEFAWNEKASVEMPKYDDAGNIVGSEIVPNMGDIEERIVPIFKLLMDPEAREYSQLGWIITQEILDLGYIRGQWDNGKFVEPDTGQGVAGYVESRLAAVLGEYMRGTEPGPIRKNTAVVYKCFEPPTPGIYPNGRMIVCSTKVLLRYEEEWPHMDAQKLAAMGIRVPYALMNYEECPGSLYGLGVVQDMLSPQKTINECVSREEEHLRTAWGKLLVEEGSRIGPTAFDDARPNEKVTYARGSAAPQHLTPEFSVMEAAANFKQQAEQDLDDISCLHEVSDAKVPQGVDSGVAIANLKASDAVGGSMFAANIEEFHRQRATLEIHIVGKNYIEPRLMFISEGYFGDPAKKMTIPDGIPQGPPDMPPPMAGAPGIPPPGPQTPPMAPGQVQALPPYVDDPDSAAMDVKAFKALNNGGSCHVMITPGSALAKDPEAQKAQIIDLLKLGVFGPPGDPVTAGIVLSLLDYAGGDEIVEAVRKAAMERMKFTLAMAPNPQGVQQQRNDAQIAIEQAKGAREVALEQAKQNHEGAILALKAQLEQESMDRKAQMDAMAAQQEQRMTLHMALLDKLHADLKITGTASPVQTASILNAMGLPTPDAPDLAATSQATAQTAQHEATTAAANAIQAIHGIGTAQAGADEASANADQAQQIADQPLPDPNESASAGD